MTHPEHARPLWLVVARLKGAKEPWYLLTSAPIRTAEEAWTVVTAYARRWQIEQTWRYNKSELGCESPRVWTWERRAKFLLMLTLVYAFLLSLLARHSTRCVKYAYAGAFTAQESGAAWLQLRSTACGRPLAASWELTPERR